MTRRVESHDDNRLLQQEVERLTAEKLAPLAHKLIDDLDLDDEDDERALAVAATLVRVALQEGVRAGVNHVTAELDKEGIVIHTRFVFDE